MIPVSVPLVFPKVVPSNWDTWNRLWESNKDYVRLANKPVVKKPRVKVRVYGEPEPEIILRSNGSSGSWIGFDIYVNDQMECTDNKYSCKNLNCPDLFPSLFDNIDKLPIKVQGVRVVQSLCSVPAHNDHLFGTDYHAVRSMLSDNNPKQTWWYEYNNTKQYLSLPDETNTWWYNDIELKHGTDFYPGYYKQLIMYRGIAKSESISPILDESIKKYPDHVIYI